MSGDPEITAPARAPRPADPRVRAVTIALAAVVVVATGAHLVQIWGTVRGQTERRVETLGQALSGVLDGRIDEIRAVLVAASGAASEHVRAGRIDEAGAVLAAEVIRSNLVREIAIVAPGGRVLASSSPGSAGTVLGGYGFLEHAPRDGRLHVDLPAPGRSLSAGAGPRQGPENARSGHLPVVRASAPDPDAPWLVASVGTESLLNGMVRMSREAGEQVSLLRYDGATLAVEQDDALDPGLTTPIFEDFLPARESGGFTAVGADGSRWIAYFDAAEEAPLIVEVRAPERVVVAAWARQLVVPLAVLALTLGAIWGYARLLARSQAQRDASAHAVASKERRLRNILETAADGIVTIDARGIVREYNRAAEAIFQLPAGQVLGRPIAEILPPELAGHQEHVERYLRTGEARIIGHGRTLETRRRDGTPMVVHLAVSEVEDQGERLFTGIVRDVTEVRDAEARFRVLFQRSGEPHLLFDRDGLVDCNEAARALLGAATLDAVRGVRLADLSAPGQGSQDAGTADALAMADAAARREGSARLAWTIRAIDGRSIPVEMTLTPIRLAGHPEAVLVALHDVTERLQHEQALRAARDAAESAALAKSSFLAMMSHELRTPMTGIIGMVELLSDSSLTAEQRRFVGALSTSAGSLLRVLNDVLDFSKVEAGRLELEAVEFDPAAVAGEVVEILSNAASRRGNELRTDWRAGVVPRVVGDPSRLRQVLLNLVGNAVKFTERGQVQVSIRAGRNPAPEGVTLRFEVQDTGVGIPEDVLPQLFNPFQQADSSTSRRYGGTGLGLAICRRLVEAMGGAIGVESQPGRGSRFWFDVPFRRARPAPRLAPPAAAAVLEHPARAGVAPRGRLRILFAEDSPVNRLLVSTRLRRTGHEVAVVDDGRAAVAAARDGDFDLVLMDMQMPELDGAAATREIRLIEGPRGKVPIIALTADARPEFREQYMRAGLDDYVTKPIDWAKLDAAIARHTSPAAA